MAARIKIAISSCLLGHAVRYDGQDKRDDNLINKLSDEFELVAICPEVAAGLGVPRPAVQLVQVAGGIKALGVNDHTLDVSESIVKVATEFVKTYHDIGGLILKSQSPSCGLDSTRVFDQENNFTGFGSGLFAEYVRQETSDLPIVEDIMLNEPGRLREFCQRVRAYSDE